MADQKIMCEYVEGGGMRLYVDLECPFENGEFETFKESLKNLEDSPISDVTFVQIATSPDAWQLSAYIGMYVPECRHFEGISLFRNDVETLTKRRYCVDSCGCSSKR